jgi:membrane protein YqaA with SNARE-associated domain
MSGLSSLAGLFVAAFAAATIIPAQSEMVLAGLLLAGNHPVVLLLVVATLGNVLGSAVNWALGRGIERFKHRRWFPADATALARAQRWYKRFGKWSLLLSWAPFVGDSLTIIAGVLREPFWSFLLLVTIAKLARYIVLCAIVLNAA